MGSGLWTSEADCISDQDQVSGEIATTRRASVNIREASLKVLVDAHRHVDTPGAASGRHDDSRIEIEAVPRPAEPAAAAGEVPQRYPIEAQPETGRNAIKVRPFSHCFTARKSPENLLHVTNLLCKKANLSKFLGRIAIKPIRSNVVNTLS